MNSDDAPPPGLVLAAVVAYGLVMWGMCAFLSWVGRRSKRRVARMLYEWVEEQRRTDSERVEGEDEGT